MWFDDVSAAITSPISLSLVEQPQPWLGEQEITVRVINREATPFRGTARVVVGRKTTDVPVTLEQAGNRLVKLPITLTGVGAHNYQISLLDAGC